MEERPRKRGRPPKIPEVQPFLVAHKGISEAILEQEEVQDKGRIISIPIPSQEEGFKLPSLPQNSFLTKYVEYASEFTDAPVEFHHFVGYEILATVLENRVYFLQGDQRIYPNLWIVLLAPSSLYRKSFSIGIGERLLAGLGEDYCYPSEFSHEKLLEILQAQPTGLFVHKEFSSLLGLLSKDYMAGAKGLLAELYDSPPVYRRKTVSNSIMVENPCIGMLSASTVEWFLEAVKEGDLKGGFLARFLFIPVRTKKKSLPFPPPADAKKRNDLLVTLKKLSAIKGEVTFSQEAKELYNRWYQDLEHNLEQDSADLLVASYVRLQAYALKLAILEEIAESGKLEVGREAMWRALRVVNWLGEKLRELAEEEFAFSPFEKNKKQVLAIIKGHPWISRSDLLRKTYNLRARDLEDVLKTLKEANIVEEKSADSGGGRRILCYKLAQ